MLIGGLQKTTLIDYPGKVACIVFTIGCNFRCGFCHNPELIKISDKINILEDVFFDFLEKRKKILDGVVITGGEPLLQKNIKDFIIKIKNEGFSVKLDTNGTFPDKLKELIDLKLIDYAAMDVKTVPEKYSSIVNMVGEDSGSILNFSQFNSPAGVSPAEDSSEKVSKIRLPISLAAVPCEGDCGGAFGELTIQSLEKNVLKSIKILLENRVDYEFRTTVVEGLHSKEDLIEISKLIKGAPRYFLQKFVAAPKLLDKSFGARRSLPMAELEDVCGVARRYVGRCEVR